MSELQPLIDFFSSVHQSWSTGGVLVGASALLYGIIKILRVPLIQSLLGKISPKLVWNSWPKWVCMLIVFVLSAGGALLATVAAGTPWIAAIPAAIVAGLGAMGIDSAVSATLPTKPMGEEQVNP